MLSYLPEKSVYLGPQGSPEPQYSSTERKLTKETLDNPHVAVMTAMVARIRVGGGAAAAGDVIPMLHGRRGGGGGGGGGCGGGGGG